MKTSAFPKLFFFVLVFSNIYISNAATYYFSSISGSDTYNQSEAQNQSTPWKSIDKLNAIMPVLMPGDCVRFKKGEIFTGTINVICSGSSVNPIIFGSYGDGNEKPVISGLSHLSVWNNAGNNIWETENLSVPVQPTALLLNGTLQALGRYPNISAPNRGYLTISSHPANSKSEFTCNELTDSIDWTGSEIVLRADHWIMNRIPLLRRNGTTLTLSYDAKRMRDNFGFFFQNHPKTLDTNGEWYYDTVNKKIQICSSTNPNQHYIEIASTNNLFYCKDQTDIVIDGLKFVGSRISSVKFLNVKRSEIKNCDFTQSGTNDINIGTISDLSCDSIKINYNNFSLSQSSALTVFGKNISICYNNLSDVAMVPGMSESGQTGYGIYTLVNGLNIERNVIKRVGYIPVNFLWSSNALIKENLISDFLTVIDDGAGIYCWMNDQDPEPVNRKVENNIVLNAIGAKAGTDGTYSPATGIYLDDRTPNVEVTGNTVSASGLFLHNSPKCTLKNNTSFGNDRALWILHDNIASTLVENCIIENNYFISNDISGTKQLLRYQVKDISELTKLGRMNNNIYCQAFSSDNVANFIAATPQTVNQNFTLPLWQDYSGYDLNSTLSNIRFPLYSTDGKPNLITNGTFENYLTGFKKWDPAGNVTSMNLKTDKLDCICLAVNVTGTGGSYSSNIRTAFPEIIQGKKYIMKADIFGTNDGTVRWFLGINGTTFKLASSYVIMNYTTTRQKKTIEFTANCSSTIPSLYFSFTPNQGEFYLDNIELYEAETVNPADYIRFEYNSTFTPKVITADKNYINLNGSVYPAGSAITIPVFGSVVLFKQ